jgi:hypothetical protein
MAFKIKISRMKLAIWTNRKGLTLIMRNSHFPILKVYGIVKESDNMPTQKS